MFDNFKTHFDKLDVTTTNLFKQSLILTGWHSRHTMMRLMISKYPNRVNDWTMKMSLTFFLTEHELLLVFHQELCRPGFIQKQRIHPLDVLYLNLLALRKKWYCYITQKWLKDHPEMTEGPSHHPEMSEGPSHHPKRTKGPSHHPEINEGPSHYPEMTEGSSH